MALSVSLSDTVDLLLNDRAKVDAILLLIRAGKLG